MIVYTDGSFGRKPKMGSYGAVIITKDGKEYRIGGHTDKCNDNNVAEVYGIASALKFINVNNLMCNKHEKICVVMTDSQYAIDHIDSVQRDEFEEKCYRYIREFRKYHKLDFFWIKGHVHDGTKVSYYNNLCDQIAGEERLKGQQEIMNQVDKILKKKRNSK